MAGTPDTGFDPTDPRIQEGIALFNAREFFACHDVLEDLWTELTGPERPFFQGLIHAADLCLFHFEGGNLTGARRMYHSFQIYVADFLPSFCGVDVERLLLDMESCFAELLQHSSGYPHGVELDDSRIPEIHHPTS